MWLLLLRSVHFLESDNAIYGKKRNKLVKKIHWLIKDSVGGEKTEVLRQIRKEETIPVPESTLKENCCYCCDVNIEGGTYWAKDLTV